MLQIKRRLFFPQGISNWPWASSYPLSMSLGCFKLKYLNKGLGFQGILVWSRSEGPWGVLAQALVPMPSARRVSFSSYCLFVRVMDMVLHRYKNALFKCRILGFFHLFVCSAWSHKGSHCSLGLMPGGRVSLSSFCYHPSPSCLFSLNADKEKRIPVPQNNWLYRAPWSCKEAGEADV